jgi:hypothetical protein
MLLTSRIGRDFKLVTALNINKNRPLLEFLYGRFENERDEKSYDVAFKIKDKEMKGVL